ncbi:MAG: HdeD family acid-resistance protein [Catenulispora sp.]|nr:HdeD family acid-resistance protein [Catenulispora sp.]
MARTAGDYARGQGAAPDYTRRDYDADNPLRMLGQAAWQALLLIGLAAIAVGVITLVWPGRTLLVLGVLFGLYLLISGVMEIVAAFGDHISAGMRVLNVIVGALSILLGVFCFRNSLHNSILLLSLWIGIGFLMWGIATVVTSASAPSGIPGRGWGVFLGVLTAIGGIIMISWPISSIVTLAVFTGIYLIAIGVVEVIHAFTLRSRVRHMGSGQHAAA